MFPFTRGHPKACTKGLIPWSTSQDFSPVLLPPAHTGSFMAADLEEWLGKLVKCGLSQPRSGSEISNVRTQPKWFCCRGSDPGRRNTDSGVMKLGRPQPPSHHSALPALLGLSDLLIPSTAPSPGRRENEKGRVGQKMSRCQRAGFSPLGLETLEGGWRFLGKQKQRPQMCGTGEAQNVGNTRSERQGLQGSWSRKSP